jgi:hypothetical protein
MTLPTNCASSKFHSAQHAYYKSSFVAKHLALDQLDPARHYQNICNTPDVKIVTHLRAVDIAPRSAGSMVRQHTRPIPSPLCRGNTVIHPSGIRRACACFLHLLKSVGISNNAIDCEAVEFTLRPEGSTAQRSNLRRPAQHSAIEGMQCRVYHYCLQFNGGSKLQGTDLHAIESPNSRICSSIPRISASFSAGRAAQHGPSIRHKKMLAWISDQGPNRFKKKATNCCVQTHQQDPHEAKL